MATVNEETQTPGYWLVNVGATCRRFQQFASKHGADNQRRFDLQLLTHHLARGVDGLVDFIVAVRS